MLLNRAKGRCRKVRGMLSEYIDGALSHNDQGVVEQHLEACEDCSGELESLRMTVRMLKRVPQVEVPRSFAIRGVEERRTSVLAPQNLTWLRPATAFATAALMVLLLVDFLPVSSGEGGVDEGELVAQPSDQIVAAPTPSLTFDASGQSNGLAQPAPGISPMPGEKALSEDIGLEDSRLGGAPEIAETRDEPGEGWPFRQIEIAVGAVMLVLMAALILTRRQRRKWRGV